MLFIPGSWAMVRVGHTTHDLYLQAYGSKVRAHTEDVEITEGVKTENMVSTQKL